MTRRLTVAATAGFLLAVTGAPTFGDVQAPPEQTPEPGATPAPKCDASQAAHRRYAKHVYRGRKASNRERRGLARMRRCARSPKARRNMRAVERRERRARRMRARMQCGTPACNERLGRWMADRRYGRGAGDCLDSFVTPESGWNHRINNGGRVGPPSGVAYGIPQANPPWKMASAGADWATNPKTQIRWLLGYVQRYGGPCGTAAHWRTARSY